MYIDKAAEAVFIEDIQRKGFASVGDLLTNDWEANPNGEGYTAWDAAAGSSDFQGRILDTVSREIAEVNRNFSERYGWDDPAKYDTESQRAAKVKAVAEEVAAQEEFVYQTVDGSESSLRPAESNRVLSRWRANLRKSVDQILGKESTDQVTYGDTIESRRPPRGHVLARAMSRFLKRYKTAASITPETPLIFVPSIGLSTSGSWKSLNSGSRT